MDYFLISNQVAAKQGVRSIARRAQAAMGKFFKKFLSCLKTNKPVFLVPIRGEQDRGGCTFDFKLLHQIHVGAPLEAHGDKCSFRA